MAKSKSTKSSSPIVGFLQKMYDNIVVRNILILFIICFFIYYGSLVVLRHYTHHGEALSVPDVRGLTEKEAGKVLDAMNLRWQLSDSVYVATVKPGAIVSQDPEPNSRVKEKRNIFLTINATTPEKVKMPDVVGISLRQATSVLEAQGLHIGRMTYIPDIAKNNVLRQLYKGREVRKGTEIVKGSEIELVLGMGLSDERTNVPNLVGLTLSDAREYLTKYSLNIGVITYDNSVSTSADSIKAFVWQQRPEYELDAMLQLGSQIDIWMTVDESKNSDVVKKE